MLNPPPAGVPLEVGQPRYADKGNMTRAEIDRTTAFLIEQKRAGQFRAFWKIFDESVNLMASGAVTSWLLAAPLALVLAVFLVVRLIPDFVFTNYIEVFGSMVTWRTYGKTFTCAVTVCTIPFWTSNLIRMIAWVPFLGRNGLLNQALIGSGAIEEPLEFLPFSDFVVTLAFVHLYTLFMVVPIFNTMMRIDRRLIEAVGADQRAHVEVDR